jgi:hypothetical protein
MLVPTNAFSVWSLTRYRALLDVLHASVKRDPTKLFDSCNAGAHSTFSRDRAAFTMREHGIVRLRFSRRTDLFLLTGIRDSTVSAFRSFERSRSAMQTAVARPDLDKIDT